MSSPYRPVVLVIRDGWGENPHPEHDAFNAVKLASTPVDDALAATWPRTLVRTCGEDVGLPADTMGNSEVGHQNIGAGRIVHQEIVRITAAIRDGSFFDNDALARAVEHAASTGGAIHLMGLASDGQVHSDLEHLYALIDFLARRAFPPDRVFVHAFLDGRDTSPTGGVRYLTQLQAVLDRHGVGRIASVIGRFYAMDRDHRWDRVARAYATLTGRRVMHPELDSDDAAPARTRDAIAAVRAHYDAPGDPGRAGDEFFPPTQITGADDAPLATISDGDAVIFFNFRGDRPREITKAFVLDDASWGAVKNGGFERGARIDNLFYVGMTNYESGLPMSAIAFDKPPKMPGILGQVVSAAGLRQFRCAETEKFPHVTFFFNDYREEPFDGETRFIAASPRDVPTYDLKPEMSAAAVRNAVLEQIGAADPPALIVVNFANGDMVGHTGKLDAAVAAIEFVDACVGALVEATLSRGGALVVTADHGNAEQMWSPEYDAPHTAHTTFDVPTFVIGSGLEGRTLRAGGRLADLAPTILELMGLDQPDAMTGVSLLRNA